jgi:DNA-directed RNA polymerase subunit M/transcription elongation factor TFIIS
MLALIAVPSRDEILNPGLRQPAPARPIYDCPQCGERAMQYFRLLTETSQSPERTDSFVCFACGSSWQM